ncbi:MAG: lipoyl(octanoyl) transferase LipB [Bdellovibrionota bacterium]
MSGCATSPASALSSMPLRWCWLGKISYAEGLSLQEKLAEAREKNLTEDTLLLLEHEAVFTAGRRAQASEILWNEEELKRRGISVEPTDRGGKITYHGPGQLVGYPIVHIEQRNIGVREWVARIELALIDYLRTLGIDAKTECGLPGVWVGKDKIGALGLHVSRGVSRHGFALNLSPDLSAYEGIVACGIQDRGNTSVQKLRGSAPAPKEAAEKISWIFANRIGAKAGRIETAALLK